MTSCMRAARSNVSETDFPDGIGVLEDSVFEASPEQTAPPTMSPGQMREAILRSLFGVLALHLTVLTAIVGGAVFIDEIRHFINTHRFIAYAAFVSLPVVHCIPMLFSPTQSSFVLPLFVIVLGYVEAVLSCFYDTYCIFVTNLVCLCTSLEIVLLSLVGVTLCSWRSAVIVSLLHVGNFMLAATVVCRLLCSATDLLVAGFAVTLLPAIVAHKIRTVVTHFTPSNFV